jgi:hypothetical protein
VPLASAPIDQGWGLTAEVVDPEGNVVVVREPMSEESLEERLAEAYEDDIPGHVAMRNPVRKAVRHASWVALRPEYKAKKAGANGAASAPKRAERVKGTASARAASSADSPAVVGRAKRSAERLKQDESRTRRARKRPAASATPAKPTPRPAKKAASRTTAPRGTARKPSTRRGGNR